MEDIENPKPVKHGAQSVREKPRKKASGKMYEDLRMSKRTMNFESQNLITEEPKHEESEPLLREEKSQTHMGERGSARKSSKSSKSSNIFKKRNSTKPKKGQPKQTEANQKQYEMRLESEFEERC